MEVDPPPTSAPVLHSSQASLHNSQDPQQDRHLHSSPEKFELTTEQIKHILMFGKDLQRLYDSLTADASNEKFKVLLQVRRVILGAL